MIVNWKPLKANRGAYFVEYVPAGPSNYLAALVLTYVDDTPDSKEIVADIQSEFDSWINRFPVPLMVTATDKKGDDVDLSSLKRNQFFVGFKDGEKVVSTWNLLRDNEIPDHLKEFGHRVAVYEDLEAVTKEDVHARQLEQRKVVRAGWTIVFLWAVVVPPLIAILRFFRPFFVRALAFIFSLYKAIRNALEMFGLIERSKIEKEKEIEELEKQHHHYHCKRNPEAFIRLRNENFMKDEEQKIQREYQELVKTEQGGGANSDSAPLRSAPPE